MNHLFPNIIRRSSPQKAMRFLLVLIFLLSAAGAPIPDPRSPIPAPTAHAAPLRSPADKDLFGMVIRNPFYEYNTDPVNYPNALNRTALERQATDLEAAGVKWVRMEFFADYDGTIQPGEINWAKYDWFINELAPKHGLKVMALLNVGMVSYDGKPVHTVAFN